MASVSPRRRMVAVTQKLSQEFPGVERSVVRDIVRDTGGSVTRSRSALAVLTGSEASVNAAAAKAKKEKRKAKQKVEKARLKAMLAEMRSAGMDDEEIAAVLGQEARSRLAAVSAAAGPVNIINAPREGKKLLVLDMDFTLFDFRSEWRDEDEFVNEMRRPYVDELLTAVYPYYDIAVWSQTTWTRLERILTALGLLTHDDYKLTFVLDSKVMYKADRVFRNSIISHEVKDLHYIWGGPLGASYNPCNTLHVDDLETNFAMNPANGLKIVAFSAVLREAKIDNALKSLSKYLLKIKDEDDFSLLDHRPWRKKMAALQKKVNALEKKNKKKKKNKGSSSSSSSSSGSSSSASSNTDSSASSSSTSSSTTSS